MKKILTVSLVAIMAVGAAHAQIASTDWTLEKLDATETTLQGKIDEKVATSTYETDKTALQGAIDAKVAQTEYDTDMEQVAKDIASKVSQTEFETVIGEYDSTKGTVEERLGQVATNENFTELTGKVTALETSLTDTGATGSRIKALETADGTMSGQITALETSLTDTGATGSRIVALETADTTMSGKITALEDSLKDGGATDLRIDAIETEQGTQNTAITNLQTADETMSGQITALQNKDTAIEGKIGTVAEGKDLATMLSEETTARTNADTELQADIDEKFAKTSEVKGAVVTTNANGEVAPVVPTESEDGVYVLTATKNGDSVTYYWENIARKTPASEPETPNGEES